MKRSEAGLGQEAWNRLTFPQYAILAGLVKAFILILLGTMALAQEGIPQPSKGDLQFFVDTATFAQLKANQDSSYLEIYYVVDRNDLAFTKQDQELWATFRIEAALTDKDGKEAARQAWDNSTSVHSEEETKKPQSLFSISGFLLLPGKYTLKTKVTDLVSSKSGILERTVMVRDYHSKSLNISDLELAASIKQDTTKTKFTRNGLLVIPNPLCLYGPRTSVLYIYSEIYNLLPDNGTYTSTCYVIDSKGKVYKKLPPTERKKPGSTCVEVTGFNIAAFPAGDYTLKLHITDNSNDQKIFSTKFFRIYHEISIIEAEAQTRQQIEMLAKSFPQDVKYLAEPGELNIYKKLSLEGKLAFQKEFWKKRDRTPETEQNEFKIEYYQRLTYVRKNFHGSKDPIDTDMGRIYLVYGSPNEIESHTQSIDAKPYEIWHYFDVEGGVIFVFADIQGFGQYQLVHSTARNELKDSNWEERIKPNR